jgi:hypothetical protein
MGLSAILHLREADQRHHSPLGFVARRSVGMRPKKAHYLFHATHSLSRLTASAAPVSAQAGD